MILPTPSLKEIASLYSTYYDTALKKNIVTLWEDESKTKMEPNLQILKDKQAYIYYTSD